MWSSADNITLVVGFLKIRSIFTNFLIWLFSTDNFVIFGDSVIGCLISESFSFSLNSPKGAKSLPWALHKEKMLTGVFFFEIWLKVKNLLRLSYLWMSQTICFYSMDNFNSLNITVGNQSKISSISYFWYLFCSFSDWWNIILQKIVKTLERHAVPK